MPMQITLSDDDTRKIQHLLTDKEWVDLPRWELLGIIADLIEAMNRGVFLAEFQPKLSPGVDKAEVPYLHNHPSSKGTCSICHVRGHSEVECGLW